MTGYVSSDRPHNFVCCMWGSLVVLRHVSLAPTGSNAVGIKRRLADAEAAEAASQPKAGPSEPSSSSSSRRGGLHQRLAPELDEVAQGPRAGVDQKGPLWKGLARRWAERKISAGELQKLATTYVGQGAEGMDKMHALGNCGSHPQNCHRALKNLLGLPRGAPYFHVFVPSLI